MPFTVPGFRVFLWNLPFVADQSTTLCPFGLILKWQQFKGEAGLATFWQCSTKSIDFKWRNSLLLATVAQILASLCHNHFNFCPKFSVMVCHQTTSGKNSPVMGWGGLSNVAKCQKMSSCQKDFKCQIVKHLDYGGGSEKK